MEGNASIIIIPVREGQHYDVAKQATVIEPARAAGIRILVETGTLVGDMVEACRASGQCDGIYTIELTHDYAEAARKRFARWAAPDGEWPRITCLEGVSSKVLPQLLQRIPLNQPVLFWLDAHWSAANTARGDSETPILAELESIFDARLPTLPDWAAGGWRDIVLIDDALLYNGVGDWPHLSEIEVAVRYRSGRDGSPQLATEIGGDIIQISAAVL